MDLGGTIKQCRNIRKLTQAQLGEAAGISVSHICLLEKNKREPSITAVESIANSLDIPLSVLVFLAVEEKTVTELDAGSVDTLSKNIMDLMANDTK